MKFSDRYLQSLKPKDKEYTVNEGHGFMLIVLPSSIKTFYIRYTFNGKQKKYRIGQYPSISLSDARDEYNECIKNVKNGIDPGVAEILVQPKVMEEEKTVEWMAKKYIEWSMHNHSFAWFKNIEITLNKHLPGHWRSKPIRDLENTELPFIMFSYCKRGGTAYENVDFGSEWDFNRFGGLGFAFG